MLPGTNGEFSSMSAVLERGALSLSDADSDADDGDANLLITQSEMDAMRARLLAEQNQGQIDHAMLTRMSDGLRREYERLVPDEVVRENIVAQRLIMHRARAGAHKARRRNQRADAKPRGHAPPDDCDHPIDARVSRRRVARGQGYSEPLPATSPASAFRSTPSRSHHRHLPSRSELEAVRRADALLDSNQRATSTYLDRSKTQQILADFGLVSEERVGTTPERGGAKPERGTGRAQASPAAVDPNDGAASDELSQSAAHVKATQHTATSSQGKVLNARVLVISIGIAFLILAAFGLFLKFGRRKSKVHAKSRPFVTPSFSMINPFNHQPINITTPVHTSHARYAGSKANVMSYPVLDSAEPVWRRATPVQKGLTVLEVSKPVGRTKSVGSVESTRRVAQALRTSVPVRPN